MVKLKQYRARLYIYLISGLLLALSIWLLALHALALSAYSITLVNFFAAEKNCPDRLYLLPAARRADRFGTPVQRELSARTEIS